MKKAFAIFAAGMIPAMMFATDFTLQTHRAWKKTANDAATINYGGEKAWPTIRLKTAEPLKPNTFYRVTFEAKSTAPGKCFCGFSIVLQGKEQRSYQIFCPTVDFQKYVFYLYSGENTEKSVPNIYFNPTVPFQMEVKGLKLDELSDDSLYGKNLLLNGNFEEGNSFQPYQKKLKDYVKIVDSANFLSGEKSLLIDSQGKRIGVISDPLPVLPGKTIEVKFYAKSDDAAQVHVLLDFGGGFGGRHYYIPVKFRVEKEWKEFSHKFKISEDFKTYPVLCKSLTQLRFGGESLPAGGNAKIYLDGISYTMIKE